MKTHVENDMMVIRKKLKNTTIGNKWKVEILRTILNIFRSYNGLDVLKLPFLEELYEETFLTPYVLSREFHLIMKLK